MPQVNTVRVFVSGKIMQTRYKINVANSVVLSSHPVEALLESFAHIDALDEPFLTPKEKWQTDTNMVCLTH